MSFFRNMDRKYKIMLGGIIGVLVIVFIVIIFIAIFGQKTGYKIAEDKLIKAAENYLKDSGFPDEGSSSIISAETLEATGYMKALDKYTKEACTGEVTISNNGGSYLYLPNISCPDYHTKTLSEVIIDKQLTTENDGLYEIEDEYIFKGKNVNNYVKLGNVLWRIIKIDEDNKLRLIKSTPEETEKVWDNKYNSSTKRASGLNDYAHSLIVENLNKDYQKIKADNRKHLQAHSVCVGKRDRKYLNIDINTDCAETVDDQYISLINTTDFSLASLDPECNSILAGNCRNYNYLYQFLDESWTSNSVTDDTYSAIQFSAGTYHAIDANTASRYFWVVYVSGDELYTSGDGSESKPYVIN